MNDPISVDGDVTIWVSSSSLRVMPPVPDFVLTAGVYVPVDQSADTPPSPAVPTFITTAMPDQPVPAAATDPTASQ